MRRVRRTVRRGAGRESGAAMLVVLMILLITTATATFAVHATTVEIRSAGYSRQAMQTRYVTEGGANAGLGYIEAIGPAAAYIQYRATTVPSTVPRIPGAASQNLDTHLLRITMEDFASAAGSATPDGPAIETNLVQVPSLGPYSRPYQPNFIADGTDLHQSNRAVAGREQSGRSPMTYLRVNLTSHGTIGVAGEMLEPDDPRAYHESALNARAMMEMGPVATSGL